MNHNKQNIALVLSSGGAKGYAHIGVIRALEESGARITSVAGTSMGALVGGLYAAGKLDEAYAWLKTIDNWEVFKLADLKNISTTGIINGEYIFDELHKLVGDVRIEELPIPFCAVAADLDTGKEKVFTKGKLLDAIRASISMPVFFVPHKIRGKRYIDGGVVNGLPINHVKRTPGDRVVAINLDTFGETTTQSLSNEIIGTWLTEGDFLKYVTIAPAALIPGGFVGKAVSVVISAIATRIWQSFKTHNFVTVLLHSYFISLKQNKLAMVERMNPDVYLNIDLKGYSTKDFADAEIIARLGYTQMMEYLRKMLLRD